MTPNPDPQGGESSMDKLNQFLREKGFEPTFESNNSNLISGECESCGTTWIANERIRECPTCSVAQPEGATTQPTPRDADENEVDDEALLPCPFCGGVPRLGESEDGGHFIECSKCGSSTNLTYFLMDDASRDVRERWNRRAK